MSDTHARFPILKGQHYDAVIHTGDIFPDPVLKIDLYDPVAFQIQWVKAHIEDFKKMLNGRPLLFVEGNHDFIPADQFEEILKAAGIEAYSLQDKVINYDGINFYGFPYVPHINGEFNHERTSDDMAAHVDQMADVLNKTYVDVIAAHCPPAGFLDLAFEQNARFGNSAMAIGLDYKINKEMLPAYYLCGHVHSSRGITVRNGMVISNAATVFHVLEV